MAEIALFHSVYGLRPSRSALMVSSGDMPFFCLVHVWAAYGATALVLGLFAARAFWMASRRSVNR